MNRQIRSGSIASFCIGEAFSPDAFATLRDAGPELTVRGRVMYLSASGPRPGHFAVIDVRGLSLPIIVPVERLVLEITDDEGTRSEAASAVSDAAVSAKTAN